MFLPIPQVPGVDHGGFPKRQHLAARQHHPSIYRPQGWIAPVVLVDGRAVATWEYARAGNQLRLKVSGFAPLSPDITNGIQAEALDLGRFLGPSSVDVQVNRAAIFQSPHCSLRD